MHYEFIAASATAPGSAGSAAAAVTGDSLTIKNSKSEASIVGWFAKQQTAGWQQLIFPSGHDTTRNIRIAMNATVDEILPASSQFIVHPQEVLAPTIAGSATAGDVEQLGYVVRYEDLPGVNGQYIAPADLEKRKRKFLTIQCTLTGAAAGYTGAELITAESDLLQANRDYAVVGIETNTDCLAVVLYGPDTAYQKAAVPGISTRRNLTSDWFVYLSQATGSPAIPVLNSGNKSDTRLAFVQDENNVSPVVSVNLWLLDY